MNRAYGFEVSLPKGATAVGPMVGAPPSGFAIRIPREGGERYLGLDARPVSPETANLDVAIEEYLKFSYLGRRRAMTMGRIYVGERQAARIRSNIITSKKVAVAQIAVIFHLKTNIGDFVKIEVETVCSALLTETKACEDMMSTVLGSFSESQIR